MKFAFTVLFWFVIGTLTAYGQTTDNATCKTASFTFACPTNSTILRSGTPDGVFVAFDNKAKVGLFAQEIREASINKWGSSDEQLLINEALNEALQSLYSTKLPDFNTKKSADFWGDHRYSRFEEKKFSWVALNKRTPEVLHLHFVIISIEGKRVLAGFSRTMIKGEGAAEYFDRWTGGGGPGDAELQKLLLSITREERPKEDLPGGPPPMAAPKKP